MPPDHRKPPEPGTGRPGEVYLEFQSVGNAVRVSATDAATGVEVVVVGPLSARQADLEKLALRKLSMALRAHGGP